MLMLPFLTNVVASDSIASSIHLQPRGLDPSIPASFVFDAFYVYSFFLVLMSPLFLFRTYLVPNPRLIHFLGGMYLGVMACMCGFFWDATLNGTTRPLNFVLLITLPMAIIFGSLAGYLQHVGRIGLGLLAGLCVGTLILSSKTGGLIDSSYAGRLSFVVILGIVGAIGSRWDVDRIYSTALIGSYTLFFAISYIEDTFFYLAPLWLLIEADGNSKYR
jgi:hypothetical protein